MKNVIPTDGRRERAIPSVCRSDLGFIYFIALTPTCHAKKDHLSLSSSQEIPYCVISFISALNVIFL